jgi:predicted alpha/beta hydrolase family esterase
VAAAGTARLLIVPGLHDSEHDHWQSWLQRFSRDAVRVMQRDWAAPDLRRWSARIGATLDRAGPGPWLAVAHSFGALALAHHLASEAQTTVVAALLVAPADPDKFGIAELLPSCALPVPATLVLSTTDPWLSAAEGLRWAQRWRAHTINLGDVGHINVAAGFGPLPLARRWVIAQEQRLARLQRPQRASLLEWGFAV